MKSGKKILAMPIVVTAAAVVATVAGLLIGCQQARQPAAPATTTALGSSAQEIAKQRGLTPQDIESALKTFTPSGKLDEYVLFASSGHAGQIFAIGVPSMRLLKEIAVFTPEPWQGYGYGSKGTMDVLEEGNIDGHKLTWGDTHHPALSETGGNYDGQFLFVNDKANGRLAVVDLRDFATKQIVKNSLAMGDHGGSSVTPDTEWVVEGGQYAVPLGAAYAPISDYKKSYRGMVTFWKFDRKAGRIDKEKSFAMELPPYWQDLSDCGKKVSDGWVFINSFNTEMATGGVEENQPPFEAGTTQKDMDYLHIINLKKAAEVAAAGKTEKINGVNVIMLKTAVAEHLLYFTPEPKSPHGVDVTPGGEYMVVSGKLDPHVSVYSFDKIMKAIAKGTDKFDDFGVPVLKFEDTIETQVELGLGPLHTQFDNQGYAYTSLFLDSAVSRWTLGGPYQSKHKEEAWKLVTKTPVQYNIGHLCCAEGDTCEPDGGYLVAMNKWAVDRFLNVGPLLPQNFQLVDISKGGTTMPVIYDMPIGNGEPHYAQMIKADKLKAWEVYPEVGWDAHKQAVDPDAVKLGKEGVIRNGKEVTINMSVIRSHYTPEHINLKKGDHVTWHLTNMERARDATLGYALPLYNINLSLEPGASTSFEFTADREGTYSYYCTEFCSALHLEMTGYMMVAPEG